MRVAKLASPAGLILALLCLLLPFMSASCTRADQDVQFEVTYTGVDVVTGGRPEIAFTQDKNREPMHRLDDVEVGQVLGEPPEPLPRQPSGWLAVALMLAALGATALPSRIWRTTATAGFALAAAAVLWGATVLARRAATDALATVLIQSMSTATVTEPRRWEHYGQVRDLFSYEYGLWLSIALLIAAAVVSVKLDLHERAP